MFVRHMKQLIILGVILIFTLVNGQVLAGSMLKGCYDLPGIVAPITKPSKGLYVFIDQTMGLTAPMKKAVIDLVSEWGNKGERIQITRFSANIKGQYSELMFDEVGNINPTEEFLFHLRKKQKKAILDCVDQRKENFQHKLQHILTSTLTLTDDKLPKTNLLHSLYTFSEQIVADKSITDKTVLLVGDGLENSDVFSFHKRGKVKKINARKMLDIVRKNQLLPSWHHAKIYFFGLGYISDQKFYLRPKITKPLITFWEHYFTEGQGVLHPNSIGVPMLLTKSIK